MFFPNKKQDLLLKASFLDNGEKYFSQWLQTYSENDFDYYTRAIIPSLLSAVSVEHYSKAISDKLYEYKRQTWLSNSCKYLKLKKIIDHLTSHNINMCILKGAAMMLFYYKDVSQRPSSSDVDILVKVNDLDKVMRVLKENGFKPQNTFNWSSKEIENAVLEKNPILQTKHAIQYKNSDEMNIDIHWNLSPFLNPIRYEKINGEMKCKSPYINILNVEMQLLHTIIHLVLDTHKAQTMTGIIDVCFLFNKTNFSNDKLIFLSKEINALGILNKALTIYKSYFDNKKYSCLRKKINIEMTYTDKVFSLLLFSKNFYIKKIGLFIFMLKENNFNLIEMWKKIKMHYGYKNFNKFIRYLFMIYIVGKRS